MKNISSFNWLQRYKSVFFTVAISLLILFAIIFFSASHIAKYFFDKEIHKIEQEKQIRIDVQGFDLEGLNGLRLKSLHLIPIKGDSLLSIEDLYVEFDLGQMFLFNFDLNRLDAKAVKARFVKQGVYCNYNFLFRSEKKSPGSIENKSDYSGRISTILNKLFRLIPAQLSINSLNISSYNNGTEAHLHTHNLYIVDNGFSNSLQISDAHSSQKWLVTGMINKSARRISCKVAPLNGGKAILPYVDQVYRVKIAFNNLFLELHPEKSGRGELTLIGSTSFNGLEVNHPRLSTENILIGNGAIDYTMHVGPNYFELDSVSEISYNKINFHPYLFAEKNTQWKFTALINKGRFSAGNFLASLPKGLFHSLSGVRVKGDLSYHFLLDLDLQYPDELKLESSLRRINFSILDFGELSKMNNSFQYTAYENDQPVRTFEVGSGSPNFYNLEQISPLLRQSVLQSEDGQFFFHRGFRMDALREALIHDLKVKRFARGGSTISMQLIKNVFLNKHKNMARKLEEALIVWLIEENRITSKSRMFEVYLNIAEWGPNVYGIGEASRFYFDKTPGELTLNESIFLASIIPSPKKFSRSFDLTGQLKANRSWYFHRIADRLYRTGYITNAERDSLVLNVQLLGEAKRLFSPIKSDTLTAIPLNSGQFVDPER